MEAFLWLHLQWSTKDLEEAFARYGQLGASSIMLLSLEDVEPLPISGSLPICTQLEFSFPTFFHLLWSSPSAACSLLANSLQGPHLYCRGWRVMAS